MPYEKHQIGEESRLGRLYIYWEEYRMETFLHIRYWFFDKKDGQYKPSTKGVAIPDHKVKPLLESFFKVLKEHPARQLGEGLQEQPDVG